MFKKIALAAAAILTVAGLSLGTGSAEASGYRHGHYGFAFKHHDFHKFHGFHGFRHYRPYHFAGYRSWGHDYGHKRFYRWW